MESAEGDGLGVIADSVLHFEELVAEGIVAGVTNGPRFGLAQIDEDEGEFRSALDNGSVEFVDRVGPGHDVNVCTLGFFQQFAFCEWEYLGESDPELLVHGRVRGTVEMIYESCRLPVTSKHGI